VNSKEQKRTVNELAELIGVEAPSISRKVQELELQGLVKKVRSVTDRRAMYIQATAKAVKVDDHIKKARRSMAEKALSDWSDKDRKLLVELMDRYVEDLIKQ
jgi:DNA-binding MarR family transcriptional regulator